MSDPALPLHLTRQQTEILRASVQIALKLDTAVLSDPEAQAMAEQQIEEREGVAGVARVDQALACARERLPVLQHLHAMLTAHGEALERARRDRPDRV
jgi:hypothetical protein